MSRDIFRMDTTISVPGHGVGALSQEQPDISVAGKVLRDAPPLLQEALDVAKEMAIVPERDLPEATLHQRNAETSETRARRDADAATVHDDGMAKPEPAASALPRQQVGQFVPPVFNHVPEIRMSACGEALADEPAVKAVRAAPAEGPDTWRTEGSEALADAPVFAPAAAQGETVAPASGLSAADTAGTVTAQEALEPEAPSAAAKAEDTTSVAAAQGDAEVDESADMPLEERMRELEVPEELLAMLRDFKPGLLRGQNMTMEQLRSHEARLADLLDAAPAGEAQEASYTAMLRARLMESRIQLTNAIESRTHLDERLGDLDALRHAEGIGKARSMDTLADLSLIWRNGREQTQLMEQMAAGDPQALQEAAEGLELGIGVVGDDLAVLEDSLVETAAILLERFQTAQPPLTHDTLRDLARLSLHAGQRPEVILELVQQGLVWAGAQGQRDTLVRVLAAGATEIQQQTGLADRASRAEVLRYVDMVFQGAYPEYADTALELKKLLVPGHEREVELQHQCTVASRHLLSLLLVGEEASGKSRTAALERTLHGMATASARSFLLTPDIVGSLTRKVDIPDFNYHIAHVALLQRRAVNAGLLPLTGAEAVHPGDVRAWCQALGLDTRTVDYAEELGRNLEDPKYGAYCRRELQRACDHFVRGFRGETELLAAGRLVLKRARLTGTSGAARREHSLYESSPEYLARLALDHHIVNLTGLIRPEDRFVQGGTGMTLDGAAIDAAMVRQTGALYANMLGGESPDDARRAVTEKAQKRRAFLSDLQRFEDHAGTMRALARSTGEIVRLRATMTRHEKRVRERELDRSLLQPSWPHRRAGRMAVCKTVLAIENLHKDLSALPPDAPGAERTDLLRRIDGLLGELHGVSPFTLSHSFRHRNDTPDLETVLRLMLPRARALRFFEAPIKVNGLFSTRAGETLRRIRQTRAEIGRLQKRIDHSRKMLGKQIGKENIRQIQQTITAGLYKVFVESQQPVSLFSIRDPQTGRAVREQLRTWGLPVDAGLTKQFIRLTLISLTKADGTLDQKALRRAAGRTSLDFAGRESVEAMKREWRDEGLSRLAARKRTRDFINTTLLSDARRRAEGVHALMREASLPGSGFVYDRTRGMVMDTGAIFTPTTTPGSLINRVNVAHPLSLRLRLMHNNSLTVCNAGQGCYQVLLKGGLAASIGATMKSSIPGSAGKAVVGGNIGHRSEHGLALTFSSAGDCEAFLNVFMRPDSGMHLHSSERPDMSTLLAATQIRFIDGSTVSADVSTGITSTLFQTALGHGSVASLAGTVSLALAGEMTRQVEQNAWGETTTFSLKGRASLMASASAGLIHDTTMFSSRKTTVARSLSLDLEQRFKLATGPKGLQASCCAETECQVGSLQGGITRDVARLLLLPSAVRQRMEQDPAFCSAFEKLLRGLPPTARLTVHRDLKPAVLEKARGLFIRARMATDDTTRDVALRAAHDLLASLDSYTATRLSVKNVTPAGIARNWSPGLGIFQYARHTSLARFRTGESLNIPLPQAE